MICVHVDVGVIVRKPGVGVYVYVCASVITSLPGGVHVDIRSRMYVPMKDFKSHHHNCAVRADVNDLACTLF